jgi:hypothetical protein
LESNQTAGEDIEIFPDMNKIDTAITEELDLFTEENDLFNWDNTNEDKSTPRGLMKKLTTVKEVKANVPEDNYE